MGNPLIPDWKKLGAFSLRMALGKKQAGWILKLHAKPLL